MEEQKPKTIKTIGLLVAIFSAFITFSNVMGALAFSFIGIGNEQNKNNKSSDFNLIEFLFENYITMCLIMVVIGILYFIGGLNIRKYKLWANRLVTYISFLLVVFIWTLMIAMSTMTAGQNEMDIFSVGAIITALFWSTPIGLLIWFLNRQKIKKHFA